MAVETASMIPVPDVLLAPVLVRRKPTQVQAMQVSVSNIAAVAAWISASGGAVAGLSYRDAGPIAQRGLSIGTLEGTMEAGVGWWVIRGVAGEFYPCRADIFEQTYELV